MSTINPLHQNITFLAADGLTKISVPITEIDAWKTLVLTSSISYAIQIGAASTMLIAVYLVTSAKKYSSPIFWTTTASLILCIITNSLVLSYYPSAWTEFYVWFAYDTTLVGRSTIATNIAANTFSPLFLLAIETSLFLQARVICGTMTDRYRWPTMILSFLVAAIAVGFNFGQMVMSNIVTLNTAYYDNPAWSWIAHAVLGTYTFSLWYFCLIFCAKLAVALWRRKQMGMKPWGPMRVLCIMSGCTMVIPSIFSALEFHPGFVWEPSSISHTLVALMLPLSSIWAAASIEGKPAESFDAPHARRKQFFGSFASDNPIHSKHGNENDNRSRNKMASESLSSGSISTFSGGQERWEMSTGNGGLNKGEGKVKVDSFRVFSGGGGANQVHVEKTFSVRSMGLGE